MNPTSARLGFCAAVAVIAAAVADPIVELASNAGCFGPGRFTDRSSLDVVPAIAIGFALLVWYLVAKAHVVLAGRALPRRVAPLLPFIFGLQIVALWTMESAEQLAVYGHVIAPGLWLGAPPVDSLVIHALLCVAVTFTVARSMRRLAATTLRIIEFVRAAVTRCGCSVEWRPARRSQERSFKENAPVLCRIGERAPPLLQT